MLLENNTQETRFSRFRLESSQCTDTFPVQLIIMCMIPMDTERKMNKKRRLPAAVAEDATTTPFALQKRRLRHVSFRETEEVIPAASPLDRIDGDWTSVWYGQHDLDTFRTEARALCREMRDEVATTNKIVRLAVDGPSRGLEQRCCLERQRRKYLSTRCIVQAQCKLPAEKLAALSQRCTAWAADVAAEEASRDFVRAYCDCCGERCPCGDNENAASAVVAPTAAAAELRNEEKWHSSAHHITTDDDRRVRARYSTATTPQRQVMIPV